MRAFFSRFQGNAVYSAERCLFLVALAVRMGVFLLLLVWASTHFPTSTVPGSIAPFPVLSQDSSEYLVLSDNLVRTGTYTLSSTVPYMPESFRLPGYPLFLAGLRSVGFSTILIALAQILLSSASVVMLYKIGKRSFGPKIAYVAAFLFVFEPTSVFFAGIILSDTLFVFLVLLAVYLCFLPAETVRREITLGALAGVVFGSAVLVRVIGEFLPLVCLWFCFCMYDYAKFKRHSYGFVGKYLVLVVFFILTLLPWSIRNEHLFHTHALSSTSDINFVGYVIPMFYAYEHGLSLEEGYAYVQDQLPLSMTSYIGRSLSEHASFQAIIGRELLPHLSAYIPFHLVKSIPFFVNDGLRDIFQTMDLWSSSNAQTNFSDLLLKGDISGIARGIFGGGSRVVLLIVGGLWWSLVSLGVVASGVYALFKRPPVWPPLFFCVSVVLYFALLTGPVFTPRYRMPAVPFMLLTVSVAGVSIYNAIRRRKERNVTIKGMIKLMTRYLVSGGTAASALLASMYVFHGVLKIWYIMASVMAFIVSILISFILQKFWTFKDSDRTMMRRQFLLFLGVGMCNLVANALLMYFLVGRLHVWYLGAQALTAITLAIWSFFLYRYVVFYKQPLRTEA